MRRSFGSSGRTSGEILRTVGRSLGSRVGRVRESLSTLSHKSTASFSLSSSSSSSSSISRPTSAAANVREGLSSSCFINEDDDWEPVQEDGVTEIWASDGFVFGPVPSMDEVEDAVYAIQQVLVPVVSPQFGDDGSPSIPNTQTTDQLTHSTDLADQPSDNSESDWIEPPVQLFNPVAMQSRAYDSVFDAFRLLQINPSVQRMVISLSSDEAVWNAVINNEVVQEVTESLYAVYAVEGKDEATSSEESSIAVSFLRWMFDNAKEKTMEFINMIIKLVNELFGVRDKKNTVDIFEGTLRSTFMLSVMVLLVIVITRIRRA